MVNLILFINSFLSYLLIFLFIAALVVAACILGIKWKKSAEMKIKKIEEAEAFDTPRA